MDPEEFLNNNPSPQLVKMIFRFWPPNLFQRGGPAQSDLKRSAPDSVPGSETKLQRISALFEDDSLPVACACVASISTKSGLDVPIEPSVDREEELQALRAAEPVIWYDTEFDREQEIAGMNKVDDFHQGL